MDEETHSIQRPPKRRKKTIAAVVFVLLLAALFFAFRSPQVSKYLKKEILRELEAATGRQVTVRKIYLNAFPFFLGVDDLKVGGVKADSKADLKVPGGKVLPALSIEKIKAYVALPSLLAGRLHISRISINKPLIRTTRAGAMDIAKRLRGYRRGKEKSSRISFGSIAVKGGSLYFEDEKTRALIELQGVDLSASLGAVSLVNFQAGVVSWLYGRLPKISVALKAKARVSKEEAQITSFEARAHGSTVTGKGRLDFKNNAVFDVEVDLLPETIKKMFSLKENGNGRIKAKGKITVPKNIKDTSVSAQVQGVFHLETLVELLKSRLKRKSTITQRIDGPITFTGKLNGRILNISGQAEATLTKGTLFDVAIDKLTSRVLYADRVMSFTRGKGSLYGGTGVGNFKMLLPRAKPFALQVKVKDVDGPQLIKLMKMKGLQIPHGPVHGEFYAKGMDFDPEGWFVYKAGEELDMPTGRVKYAQGGFWMKDKVVRLSGVRVNSEKTEVLFDGSVDIVSKTLDIAGEVVTSDILDLTSPYFDKVTGRGRATGRVTGSFDDPVFEGSFTASDTFFDQYPTGPASGEITYTKNLLIIKRLVTGVEGQQHSATGVVRFPLAQKMLQLREPEYDVNVSLNAVDLNGLLKIFHLDLPLEGTADSELKVKGPDPSYFGSAIVKTGSAYGFALDLASFDYSWEGGVFKLGEGDFSNKGGSRVKLDGQIDREGAFDFSASSKTLRLRDILPAGVPVDSEASFTMQGSGTLEEPEIVLSGRLKESLIKGSPAGGGKVEAKLTGRSLAFDAMFFDGKISLKGKARLTPELPWSARLDIELGRYDSILEAYLQEVPEDLLLNMKGSALLKGTRRHLEANALITQLNLVMFGQGFSNASEIRLRINDRNVAIKQLEMRSGEAFFSIGGSMELSRNYGFFIEGKTSLAPLKGLSKKIGVLKGDADFAFSVQGSWDRPVVFGSLELVDGSFSLKGVPQRLTSIEASIYMDGDRTVVQRLGGKLGGGDIDLSGVLYMNKLKIERLYIDAMLNDITLPVKKGFPVNFGGNLVLRGSPDSMDVTGEVQVNRALYKERVEWKTWLLLPRAKAPKKTETWLDRIRMNIKVYGRENVGIDNNLARASLNLDVTLKGTVARPRLYGRVESADGKVYFRNNEFSILSATADYSDSSHTGPFFDIFAETSVTGYHIWLRLEGRLDQLDMSLTSDPTLEEVEIFALLALGQFGDSLKGLESGIGAAEAASVLTGKWQDVLEERLKYITGLDRFQIDPYVSKSTGAITPRITVSKKLMAERLFVTYSTAVSTTEEQVLKLEYLLKKNVSLVGIRDERGSLGGDVKFKFRFK